MEDTVIDIHAVSWPSNNAVHIRPQFQTQQLVLHNHLLHHSWYVVELLGMLQSIQLKQNIMDILHNILLNDSSLRKKVLEKNPERRKLLQNFNSPFLKYCFWQFTTYNFKKRKIISKSKHKTLDTCICLR